MSAPPILAATATSLISRENNFPFFASARSLRWRMFAHLLCPAICRIVAKRRAGGRGFSLAPSLRYNYGMKERSLPRLRRHIPTVFCAAALAAGFAFAVALTPPLFRALGGRRADALLSLRERARRRRLRCRFLFHRFARRRRRRRIHRRIRRQDLAFFLVRQPRRFRRRPGALRAALRRPLRLRRGARISGVWRSESVERSRRRFVF